MLNEQSIKRAEKHLTDSKETVVILTAFRAELSKEQNKKNNTIIASKLRSAGFGFFYVDGHFIENQGTPEEDKVAEDSIFVIADEKHSQQLIDLAHKLANQYDQDSILVKELDKGVYFLDQSKKKEYFTKGSANFKKIGDFYTKLRNKGDKSGTFAFESIRFAPGLMKTCREYLIQQKENT